jgi:hypothetical protein
MNRFQFSPEALVGSDESTRRVGRLARHRIAPGQLDIRRWIAFTEDGQRVGRVVDLIVDMQSLLVTCVEVELDVQLAGRSRARRIVVPIACAQVSGHRKHVNIRGITAGELLHAPRLSGRRIGAAEQDLLRRFFLGQTRATGHLQSIDDAELTAEEQARFWGVRQDGRRLHAYLRAAVQPE